MIEPSDIVSLIDGWPSLGDFARDAGVTYGAAKQMRRRRSIPVTYWPTVIASGIGRSLGVTPDLLMRLHAEAALSPPTAAGTEVAEPRPTATDGPEPFDHIAFATHLEARTVDREDLACDLGLSVDRLEDILAGRAQPDDVERVRLERDMADYAPTPETAPC